MPDRETHGPEQFLNLLSSMIPDDILRYSREAAEFSRDTANSIADSIDRHIAEVGDSLRETLQTSSWLPDSMKPPPPSIPVHRASFRAPNVPLSYFERVQGWISKNRAITAAVVAFIGTGTFIIVYRRRRYRQKRRAKRAANGVKTEVIVLAGSPHSLLTRTLARDLERRGFIVYIPVSTESEEQAVKAELRADIHPLQLDITSPTSTIETIAHSLTNPESTSLLVPQPLHLASLILLPPFPSTFPIAPIPSLTPSTWSEVLNTHLLAPFTLTHAFLPLLIAQSYQYSSQTPPSLFTSLLSFTKSTRTGSSQTNPPTSLLLLTPSIPPSLHLPNHAPSNIASAAITSYISTLRTELALKSSPLTLTHLKLGAFDFSNPCASRDALGVLRSSRFTAPKSRNAKEKKRRSSSASRGESMYPDRRPAEWDSLAAKGSPLRELHNGVFDAVTGRSGSGMGGTVYLGRGSWAYDFVGRWVPSGAVGWMVRRGGVMGEEGGREQEWEEVEVEGE